MLNSNSELNDCILSIEENKEIKMTDPISDKDANFDYVAWHMKRLSKRDLPLEGIVDRPRVRPSHVYILDTGIDCSHD